MPIDPTTQTDKAAQRRIQAHVARRQHQRRRELELEDAMTLESKSGRTSPSAPVSHLSPISRSLNTHGRSPSTAEVADTAMSEYPRPARPTPPTAFHTSQLNATKGTRSLDENFWTVSTEAMLATTVLFTACHLRHYRAEVIMSPSVLRLRSATYNVVQETINNESDQLSDVMILAIVKLALFEAVFGRRDAYKVQMQGIAQMVRLRLSLLNLGFNGYLAHFLMWFDANLSVLTQTSRFPDIEIELAKLGLPEGCIWARCAKARARCWKGVSTPEIHRYSAYCISSHAKGIEILLVNGAVQLCRIFPSEATNSMMDFDVILISDVEVQVPVPGCRGRLAALTSPAAKNPSYYVEPLSARIRPT
ncbi:hypothetical protein AC578_6446 [Pseudocercospora eumusae]|uniref:Uncharacterized protein n=1 Tax=Pseudocercospora eumusae TaxID=321146 RepID=A0A139H051_9PEZI|nr:hypothetical protein AC578_6446 [Pseudocercospora eumusae]